MFQLFRRRAFIFLVLACCFGLPALAGTGNSTQFLVRARSHGAVQSVAALNGLKLLQETNLDYADFQGVVALLRMDGGDAAAMLAVLAAEPNVVAVEINAAAALPVPAAVPPSLDQLNLDQSTASVLNQSTASVLNSLLDQTPMEYFGATVPNGYLNQPAMQIVKREEAQKLSTGSGVRIALIDAGIDPGHPAYSNVLTPGFNFVDDNGDVSVFSDLDQSTASVLNQSTASVLNQSTASVLNSGAVVLLDQSTASVLNGASAYLGHATETAGLLHLVAPQAQIMPLKAFKLDGTATLYDIIRALNFATDHGANVISMSFSCDCWSPELTAAIRNAVARGALLVGSTGNDNQMIRQFPAAYQQVMGVGASNFDDSRASFSNYGSAVLVVAPGTGVVTPYPGGRYAAVWGTSFSTPQVAGQVALLLSKGTAPAKVSKAITGSAVTSGYAQRTIFTGFGRIDLLNSLKIH